MGLANINADAEIRRLENIIIDGIDPRISGIRIKAIDSFESGPVILLRIPKSYLSPHMLKLGDYRFYSRTNAGKQPLDVMQIRSAFAIAESLPEKVRRFRDERIGRIVAGETPIPLPGRPKIVLHLLPAASLDPATRVDFSVLTANHKLQEPINSSNGWIPRFNLDGYLVQSNAHQPLGPATYLQAFQNGALEAVESQLIWYDNENNPYAKEPQNLFATLVLERILIMALSRFLMIEAGFGLEPPMFVMLSLISVKGYGILSPHTLTLGTHRFDRDVVLLPESMMESFDEPAEKLLQSAFDAIWQAAGYERCLHYTDGQWRDERGRPAKDVRFGHVPRGHGVGLSAIAMTIQANDDPIADFRAVRGYAASHTPNNDSIITPFTIISQTS